MTRFKNIKIKQIFKIHTGRDVIISETKDGNIPLVSHQHDNNGMTKLIHPLENRILFNYKETIALADRGVFYATTHNKNFYIGTRVKALTFIDGEKNEKIRLYFVTAINKLQILFKEYLDNATDKLPDLEIMLPVDKDEKIDYKYMEECIDKKINQTYNRVKKYLEVNDFINKNLTKNEKVALDCFKNKKIKFNTFSLDQLFVSENGDTDIQQKDINGIGEYVISSGENNNRSNRKK